MNGQKTWTTLAQDATHIFMLVRTDKTVKKQEGISFLLVDLATPGHHRAADPRTSPATRSSARCSSTTCACRASNLVGELNQGWTIAKALLGFERIFGGSPKHSQYALKQLDALAARARALRRPGVRRPLRRTRSSTPPT